jgi:hypothetical protein
MASLEPCWQPASPQAWLFMIVVSIQAVTRTGFDLTRHPASLLSLGEFGWVQVGNFIVAGLLVVVLRDRRPADALPRPGGQWGHRRLSR